MAGTSLLTFTVMKNEGPFIVEWVAWQRVIGADRIVVLTNDCDDGTDALLDHLDRRGVLRHLPNPSAIGACEGRAHIAGFSYASLLREWREADYILLSDVDEFPVIRTGTGTLRCLLDATDYPDVVSLSECIFGTGKILGFEDRPVTETFTRSASLTPGKWKARRGVKSLTRNRPGVLDIRNHRPLVVSGDPAAVRWVDGSGRRFPDDLRGEHHKGSDCRGAMELAVVNHYPLRSLESYLVKIERGDAVTTRNRFDETYFRRRNLTEVENTLIAPMLPRLRTAMAGLMQDPETARLHGACVAAHREKIARLKVEPGTRELLRRIGVDPETVWQAAA